MGGGAEGMEGIDDGEGGEDGVSISLSFIHSHC